MAKHTEEPNLLDQILLPYLEATNAVDLDSPDFPEAPLLLSFLGTGLCKRFQRDQNPEDLKRAIQAFERIIQKDPPGSSIWSNAAHNMGGALHMCYQLEQDVTYLDRAIRLYGQVLEHLPDGAEDLPEILQYLCTCLLERFAIKQDMKDIDHAIRAYRLSLDKIADVPYRVFMLGNYVKCLLMRCGVKQSREDLLEAMKVIRMLGDENPDDEVAYQPSLQMLGQVVITLYEHIKNLADLDDFIQVLDKMVAETAPDADFLPVLLNYVAYGYMTRYGKEDEEADLLKTIDKQEQALYLCEPGDFYEVQCTHNLGSSTYFLYQRTKDLAHLNRAIGLMERAIALLAIDTQTKQSYNQHLASMLRSRFERTESMADLERANQLQAA